MTTAATVVTTVINLKLVESVQRPRRGAPGYGLLAIMRVLVYALLAECFTTRKLRRHRRKRPGVVAQLGLGQCPHKRTFDRWRRRYQPELEALIERLGDLYVVQRGSRWTILDSTPLEDERDPDARVGHTSKGAFKGFKLHMSCDEDRVPLRAHFTTGNVHDIAVAERLLAPTPLTGGDAGYDAAWLKDLCRARDSFPIFVDNPRRRGKETKQPTWPPLKRYRVCVEQCNSIVKTQTMKNLWTLVKGFWAKATFALAAVLATQALAVFNLTTRNYPTIRMTEVRD